MGDGSWYRHAFGKGRCLGEALLYGRDPAKGGDVRMSILHSVVCDSLASSLPDWVNYCISRCDLVTVR